MLEFPDKKYKTVVIDPPWDLTPVFTSSFGMTNFKFKDSLPYETISEEDLKNFPIDKFAEEECQLFLWATHSTLPQALELVKYWGFKYHCLLTWDKTKGICLCGINRRTEFVIYAYRGKQNLKQMGVSLPTYFREVSTVHSRKPRSFYHLLVKSTPEPRIDIFARKCYYGFDTWGDQVEEVQILESFIDVKT